MAVNSVADLSGRVLAGRYRLLAAIGAGASGRVYVADDTRLRRRVAVKVLHTALSDDAAFLRRFRTEAQLAASLHHPNVVTVHDWGEDGVPFMVLELLEGGSLRSMLDQDVRLTPAQTALVGRQVCSALEYAHGRGLVHRDIKPANLLFDEHGVVRVADFGLARALAEASWTEPAGAVVGTARYASPEQATGSPIDGRSDLYALALVLVESVTGRVPFAADTPVGTLVARTQGPIVAPAELGPLGPVVERAGQPDPDDRFADAIEMGLAIASAAAVLPPPGALALAGPAEVVDDPHPTQLRSDTTVIAPATGVYDQDTDTGPAVEPAPVVSSSSRRRRPRRWTALIVPFFLVFVVLSVAAVLFATRPSNANVAAPNLVGLPEAQAAQAATISSVLMRTEEADADDPKGTVLRQSPSAGAWVKDGGTVHVVVSRGPKPVPVPDVTDKPFDVADGELEAAGFVVKVGDAEYNEDVPKGTVLRTEPAAAATAKPDSEIVVIVSNGPAPVAVPALAPTDTYDQAAAKITAARLVPARADVFSDTVESGKVVGTVPPAGSQVGRGSTVTIQVSKGAELVTVPDLRNDTVEVAFQKLQALGLVADTRNYGPGKKVQATNPLGGTQVKKGSTVVLFL